MAKDVELLEVGEGDDGGGGGSVGEASGCGHRRAGGEGNASAKWVAIKGTTWTVSVLWWGAGCRDFGRTGDGPLPGRRGSGWLSRLEALLPVNSGVGGGAVFG
ncbi:hypothetical protein MLD38_037245 [Melastoma candidum]|uniref:Uncharacterized protein n=1 Tax=Melastoma candidum TaxID=119954 RepID=A0ACB9LM54_9MYRT|nr:hypothetical protein MLD38_037245 [Melastoma candidum]